MARGGKVIDWITLEVDYTTSTIAPYEAGKHQYKDKTEFFRLKGIPHSTWGKNKGQQTWDAKRTVNLQKSAEKAILMSNEKRAKELAEIDQMGSLIQNVGVESLVDKGKDGKLTIKESMKPTRAVEAASLIKTGIEIRQKVVELESGGPSERPINVGVQVNVPGNPTYSESECIAEIESKLSRYLEPGKTA